MSGLKACECGSDDLIVNCVSGSPKWVECDKCGRSGDLKWTEAEAIAAWNARPEPAEPARQTVTREEVIACFDGCLCVEAYRDDWFVAGEGAAADAVIALLKSKRIIP